MSLHLTPCGEGDEDQQVGQGDEDDQGGEDDESMKMCVEAILGSLL